MIVVISKSKVYELALSSIKEEHIGDFMKLYIPAILPILTEYGGRFLINGAVQSSVVKAIIPIVIVLTLNLL
jgi:hypothetical protein